MRDAEPDVASVDDILRKLAAVREPDQRLPLLLAAADNICNVDARRALDHALEATAVAANLADHVAHAEALYQQGRCSELLLDHGANLNAKDDKGKTPLTIALEYKQTEMAKLLRDKGAVQ